MQQYVKLEDKIYDRKHSWTLISNSKLGNQKYEPEQPQCYFDMWIVDQCMIC